MKLIRRNVEEEAQLHASIFDILNQVNSLSESYITAKHNATDTTPTTTTAAVGDQIPKLTVTEAGSGYAHIGWIYGNQGAGKAWLPMYSGTAVFGSMAYQNANAVAITGGSITGITDLAVADGGTGASTLTGYVKGSGTAALTASATIPNTDITGLGTMSTQNASAVAITGGTINGATVGATTPAAVTATTSVANSFVPNSVTVPSNGMYLPATNTLGWSVNSALKLSLDATHLFSYSTWLRHGTTNANEYFEFGRDTADGMFKFNGAQTTFNGYKWQIRGTEVMRIGDNGNIGVNGTANAAALLDLASTTKGFLPPRMTTTERDAIASPPAGLMIYNTTTNKLNVRVAAAWEAVTSA